MDYVFGTGTARGGTGLVVQTLRAHNDIEIAMEPFLSLFKSYRASVINSIKRPLNYGNASIDDPISAIYFEETAHAYLQKILHYPENYTLDENEFCLIREGIRSRAAYDAADLIPFLDTVRGDSYSGIIHSLISMIAIGRQRPSVKFCGFMENWCVEFFPFLLGQFPNAKFFIILRDPRAVICSALNAPKELQSTFLSYLRALRKLFDLTLGYLADPRFNRRLCVVKFEALVANPSKTAKQLCDFFELSYDEAMIDPKNHVVPGTDHPRDGVSSFEQNAVGYSVDRINRWKEILSNEIVEMVNALMEEELKIFGYLNWKEHADLDLRLILTSQTNNKLINDQPKWSTDLQSFSTNYGAELIRKEILSYPSKQHQLTKQVVDEQFLSASIFNLLNLKNSRGNIPTEWTSFNNIIRA